MHGALLSTILGFAGQRMEAGPHVRTVKELTAVLSTELGRSVEVERSLRGVPVFLDEPGQSAAKRLDDLAFALRASLVRDGRTLRIERLPKDRKEVKAAHQSALRRRIEAGLATADRNLARYAPLGSPMAQARAAQESVDQTLRQSREAKAAHRAYTAPADLVSPGALTPAGRLTLELVRRIGPERLADLAPDEVRFFSNHPNSAESPLPECADLAAGYERLQSTDTGGGAKGGPTGGKPTKLILRLDEFGATLGVFDAHGRTIDRGGFDYANRVVYLGPSLPSLGASGAAWRPLDESARSLAAFLHYDPEKSVAVHMRRLAGESPTERPPEPFLRPDLRDPLDFVVREGLLALPNEPKTQGMVVALADWTLDLADECVRDGRLDATAFARALWQGNGSNRVAFERVAHGGTTVVRPADPLATEAALADRAALGPAIRRIVTEGRIDVRNWPAVSLALYPSRNSRVTSVYLGALQHCGLRTFEGAGYGLAQFALVGAALEENRAVINAGLPPFREILRDGIVHRWLDLKASPGFSDLAVAPSTLLASGALDRGRIDLVSIETVVADRFGDAKEGFPDLEPDRIGADTLYMPGMRRTEARTQALIETNYLKARYRLGRRLSLATEVRLDGPLPIRIELRDHFIDRRGLTFGELPLAFRNGIMEGVRKNWNERPPLPQAAKKRHDIRFLAVRAP